LEESEVNRRVRCYRGDRDAVPVGDRTVILVDDGIVTGFTARAGMELLRRQGARAIVLAVPVGPADTVKQLRAYADQVICLRTPTFFAPVGHWYSQYWPVGDAEVARLLAVHTAVMSDGIR
jgi:predicted phosphoribosyltransferase